MAEVPNAALDALAADNAVVGLHFDRPIVPMLSSGGAAGGRGRADSRSPERLRRHRRRRRDHRLGHHRLARRSGADDRAQRPQRPARRAASSTSSAARRVRATVTATARTSRGSSPATATTPTARMRASHPGAQLLILKVLDDQGRGTVSDVIRAIDFAVANRARFNLRIINLSIGAAVLESYETDPLALAARRAVEAGLVVVAAAGNFGKNADGEIQYGGITAPGNCALGADRWRLQHVRHAGPVRRSRRRLQLARSDGRRLQRQARHPRAGHAHRLAERSRQLPVDQRIRPISSTARTATRFRTSR